MTDRARELVERLQKREHYFRNASEGEYDAELLRKARFMVEDFIEQSRTPPEGDTVSEGVVEQVARAIAKADGKDPDAPAWVRLPSNEQFGVCWRDQYAYKARAAIAALQSRVSPQAGMREALADARECLRLREHGPPHIRYDTIETLVAALSTAPIPHE